MSSCEADITDRIRQALGDEMIKTLEKTRFCIVGCGGTGALFAEMLVRTGAKKLTLIDGDHVDSSNLNRVVGFVQGDIGKKEENKKVKVLESRFKCISPDMEIETIATNFRKYDRSDVKGQKARNAVCNSDIIVIAVDKNQSRIECEKLANDKSKKTISMGVFINEGGDSGFECTWMPETPHETADAEGYGSGSYISIVVETTSVAFTMLLHHLENPESSHFRHYYKEYKNYSPYSIEVDGAKHEIDITP